MSKLLSLSSLTALLFGLTILSMPGAVLSADKVGEGGTTGSTMKPADTTVYAAYCENIGDAAAEARAAIRANYLQELEARVNRRTVQLEVKLKAVEKWMKRRESFIERAQQNLVAIYTAMRPEAAAQQISIMDDETAAAILLKLKPRTASAILNEIQPARAAGLAGVIAGSAKTQKSDDKS